MTTNRILFTAASDGLWRDVPIDHAVTLRVFGIGLTVESNSPTIIEWASTLFPVADDLEPRARHRVIIEPSRTTIDAIDNTQWRVPDADHALLRAPGLVGALDLGASQGVVYAEESYARFRSQFVDSAICGPVLSLVTRHDRQPVHAAALRCGDAGLLLLGTSGTGKSTTCYVASRAGIDVLTDDCVRVQHSPELRVWGAPGRIHLLEDAAKRFSPPTMLDAVRITPNGKTKRVVMTPKCAQPHFLRRVRACLLQRGDGPVSYAPMSADEIVTAILTAPEAVCDFNEPGRVPAARAVAGSGGWRLTLSKDPEETVPVLKELLAQV